MALNLMLQFRSWARAAILSIPSFQLQIVETDFAKTGAGCERHSSQVQEDWLSLVAVSGRVRLLDSVAAIYICSRERLQGSGMCLELICRLLHSRLRPRTGIQALW